MLGVLGMPWLALSAGVGWTVGDLALTSLRSRHAWIRFDDERVSFVAPKPRLGRISRTVLLNELGGPQWVREQVDGDERYAVLLDVGAGAPVRVADDIVDPRDAQAVHETLVRLIDHFQRLGEH